MVVLHHKRGLTGKTEEEGKVSSSKSKTSGAELVERM